MAKYDEGSQIHLSTTSLAYSYIFLSINNIMIPAIWYNILKLKKVEVVAQLIARKISHDVAQHHMTLKSMLYKAMRNFVENSPAERLRSLTSQFNNIIRGDWTKAFRASGKTFKEFKKELLRKFHPDVNSTSIDEATTICQEINGWTEPSQFDDFDLDMFMRRWSENIRKKQWYQWEGLYRFGWTVDEIIEHHHGQINSPWDKEEDYRSEEEAAQEVQEWLDNRTSEFIDEYLTYERLGEEYRKQQEEEISFAELLQGLEDRFAESKERCRLREIKDWNKPSLFRKAKKKGYTKYGEASKARQQNLIRQYGDVFYTYVKDVPTSTSPTSTSPTSPTSATGVITEDVIPF